MILKFVQIFFHFFNYLHLNRPAWISFRVVVRWGFLLALWVFIILRGDFSCTLLLGCFVDFLFRNHLFKCFIYVNYTLFLLKYLYLNFWILHVIFINLINNFFWIFNQRNVWGKGLLNYQLINHLIFQNILFLSNFDFLWFLLFGQRNFFLHSRLLI